MWVATLFPDRTPGQRGEIDSHHHQACLGEKTETDPAKALQKPAGEAVRQLGQIRQSTEDRFPATESTFPP